MRLWTMLLGAATILMATAHPALADTHVKVLGTWPTGHALTLGRNETYYVHLGYTSDQPVHIWVRPYFDGRPADAGSNPSRLYPAGSGEALGWFFLSEPGVRVDEVRISAGDGSTKGTHVVATYPVSLTTDNQPASASPPPAWVGTLRAADKAAQDAAYQKAMNTPSGIGENLFFGGFMLAVVVLALIGLAAPAWGLWRWRGGWRITAAVPAAVMAFVVLRIFVDTARDSTSHNLWPFEIVTWGGLSCIWMLVAALLHRFSDAART